MRQRLVTAHIDLSDYRHNLGELRTTIGHQTKLMAVVKANAYGHGIERMAEAAIEAGTDCLGVASLGEVGRLRGAGVRAPIIILGYLDPGSVADAVALDAEIMVMDSAVLVAAATAGKSQSKTVRVHLKVDTGMHRAGCEPGELLDLAREVVAAPELELAGVCTHFAESEALDQSFTDLQFQLFQKTIGELRGTVSDEVLFHCANSAATLASPQTHLSMVRPGLLTYGLNPFPPGHPNYDDVQAHFRPVLSLKTQVVHIRTIEKGEWVGYNRRWQAGRRSTLALLPVGYGDGYRRSPRSSPEVLIGGERVPVVGGVAMDQMVADITELQPSIAIGEAVVLIGSQGTESISVDEIAADYGTISYEVVTGLSERVERVYE